MMHRGIATLAGALMVCFLLLSHFEPDFFLLHFYQSAIYLAIILMLFYFEDHWAYMLGMLAPSVWLLMMFATGLMTGALRQLGHHLSQLIHAQRLTNEVSFIAAVTMALALAMVIVCAYRWRKEYAGTRLARSTALISGGIVALYYAVLVLWFWQQIPQGPSAG